MELPGAALLGLTSLVEGAALFGVGERGLRATYRPHRLDTKHPHLPLCARRLLRGIEWLRQRPAGWWSVVVAGLDDDQFVGVDGVDEAVFLVDAA